jgi:hypothetical protein
MSSLAEWLRAHSAKSILRVASPFSRRMSSLSAEWAQQCYFEFFISPSRFSQDTFAFAE